MNGIFHCSRHGRIRKDRERAHYALVRKYNLLIYHSWLTMTISGVEVGIKCAPIHLSLLNLVPSSRRSGTRFMPMPPINLYCGREYFRRAWPTIGIYSPSANISRWVLGR